MLWETRWGRDSDQGEGALCCAPGRCKVHQRGILALDDCVRCKLGSRLILQPLPCMDKPSLSVCLTVCLGRESLRRTEGVIYLRRQQPSPERAATAAAPEALSGGGSPWPLLCILPPLAQ